MQIKCEREEEFRPITLVVKLESADEVRCIGTLMTRYDTLPKSLVKTGELTNWQGNKLSSMMKSLGERIGI